MGQTASGDVQNGGKRPMGSAVGTTRGTGTMHGVLGGSSSQSKPSAAQSGGDNDIAGNRKRSKPPDDDAVELVGERTLQQRNAEGFAAAIHLDDDAGTPQWADHGVRSGGSGAAGSATATPADPSGTPSEVEGMEDVMKAARLQGRLGEALGWCGEQGVTTVLMLQEMTEWADKLAEDLHFLPAQTAFFKRKLGDWSP
mmetsp:Transcript_46244/g.104213  ORF Transcript_46244/g.104213 Transcript_46244/m.104213 type:complete len:198 (-) Transcript_46244:358-951(-)